VNRDRVVDMLYLWVCVQRTTLTEGCALIFLKTAESTVLMHQREIAPAGQRTQRQRPPRLKYASMRRLRGERGLMKEWGASQRQERAS